MAIDFKNVRETLQREFRGKALDKGKHGCRYYNHEGKKCVIGCFLSDEDAKKLAEENPYISDIAINDHRQNIDFSKLPTDNEHLLSDWQDFHDKKLKDRFPLQVQKDALFNEFVRLTKVYGLT